MIRSFRSAFILLFTALLVVTTLAVGFNAYRRASEVSLGLSTEIIDGMSARIADRALAILEDAYSYLEINAVVVASQGLAAERDPLFRLLWRQLDLSPHLSAIFAAEPGGGFIQVRTQPQLVTRFIDRSGATAQEQIVYRDASYAPIAHIKGGGLYDPRAEAWYVGALAGQGNVSWSAVYRLPSIDKPGITAAKTVYGPDNRPLVVLGVDIALEGLSEFLGNQPLAKGAVAMIVDADGNLVAYPYQLALKPRPADAPPGALPTIDELEDPALVHAYRTLTGAAGARAGETSDAGAPKGFAVTQTNGSRYIARLQNFPSHWTEGWQLLVVVPEGSLLAAAGRLLSESAVISLIILVASVALVSLLALRLFRPLRKLVENTELVKQMRFSEVRPVASRFVEIQAMDAAICGMKHSLETLEKFVPTAVARGLMASGLDAAPGGEVRPLTLLCAGMATFGRLCRSEPPERITALLTDQMDRFTQVLMHQAATLADYLGDGVLAFWGAPTRVPDGPARACTAALQCLRSEADLARDDASFPKDAALTVYAIHAGPCIVGNIGSQRYLSYAAIGDAVELTWRLKQMNRLYGTRVIVTGPVWWAVADAFWFRRLDVLRIHDGAEVLELYELQGERSQSLGVADERFARAYEEALALLLAEQWGDADHAFAGLQAERPDDPALALMRRRCAGQSAHLCESSLGLDAAGGPFA